ncbi:beta-ketoacyl synthase N-terminal-like domain-containing protein [Streptomyces tendae]|uniref:beta-ketoacyl synthase N-terminal-like domain-containing protein n=1 Tax=Streptomyces tendae TaxID=1932 RepID=UPI0036C35C7D
MTTPAVLVTGVGVRCSTASDVAGFTAALRAGTCGIRTVGGDTPGPGPRALAPLDDFDLDTELAAVSGLPETLRRSASRAARRSPQPVRSALLPAVEAWLDAGLHTAAVPGDRVALVVGGTNLSARYVFEQHRVHDRRPAHLAARYALHVQDTDHVGTLSQVLGVTGEGCVVGASSASGGAAVVQAARLIECGAADVALVVGALARLGPLEWQGLSALGALAAPVADGTGEWACRPFDVDRRGFVPGEGAACLVLESAASARARGAGALARLAGYAQRLDANSLSDPSAEGEARTMNAALRVAGLAAGDLDYVNAHATGTPAGDAAELAALRQVLGDESGRPWLNATKALVGHCLSAAGVLEAVATVVQLRAGFVHPNPALRQPVDEAFRYAGRTARPARLEHAMTTSFGFGGFNTALVLSRG